MARFFKSGLGSSLPLVFSMALWTVSMVMVYDENYATSSSTDLSDINLGDSETGEFHTWMNITMGDQKIGYSMQSLSKTPLGYVLKDYSLIKLPMGGTVREVYLDSYAVLNLDYSMKVFTFSLISDDYTTDVQGEVRDSKLVVRMRSGNSESIVSFDAGKGIYLPAVVPLLAKARGFVQGEFFLPTFDPFSLSTDELEIVVGAVENVQTDFGTRQGYRISIAFSGVTSLMWVGDGGVVLREEETGGLAMVSTAREKALDMPVVDGSGLDILERLAVPSNGEIKDARNVRYLKVSLHGIEPGFFDLDDDFQTVISADPLVMEIHPYRIKESALIDSAVFLEPRPLLQVDDPRIINAAYDITNGLTSPTSKAEALEQWVFENIEKNLTISLPSAVDVLEVKSGDCNEHTSLYTALARASGLPTKICIGIVYKDGYFYYHAWPAVYLDGWRPLDPTFGQQTTDAVHIKLLEGGFERQADLMRVVGKISVTVLEYSHGENL
ncbi:MAG: transglutaminase domain-containing protein [candidate division Zixibacteria bacterium]